MKLLGKITRYREDRTSPEYRAVRDFRGYPREEQCYPVEGWSEPVEIHVKDDAHCSGTCRYFDVRKRTPGISEQYDPPVGCGLAGPSWCFPLHDDGMGFERTWKCRDNIP
jgi:hypothetical protein